MSPSTSREVLPAPTRTSRTIFGIGVAVSALLFLVGAWERRWIADDGLIVLRTVRNLLAGNGPVFNAGERVETNTSTIWTYLVYAVSWLSEIRLEYVVLTIALVLSTAAIVLAMFGTYALRTRSAGVVAYLPAGVLVYIAVPPARDFATSGLETCLVIFWIAALWLLMVRWSTRTISGPAWLFLAFWAGLGPLVRPELLILSGLALIMLFLARQSWKSRLAVFVVAGIVPVGYQIWRMGYYGLPYPNTAVSKDAGGAKWAQGFDYLWNLLGPYMLWLPLLLMLVVGVVTAAMSGLGGLRIPRSRRDAQSLLRSRTAVVAFVLIGGLLSAVYAVRVGGDFMHGRTLLPALFTLLLPISVVPVTIPNKNSDIRQVLIAAGGGVLWLVTIVWAFFAANTTGMPEGSIVGRSGIVDERAFYSLNTGHAHPILATDYLDYPRMRPMVETIANTPDGGLLLPSAQFTYWDVVPPPLPIPPGGAGHTVYFLNLGMTSMNVGLDVRVIDQMGLAYPLASHTERLENGRIGHDKNLYPDWVVADLGLVDKHPFLPWYMDEDWVAQARVALSCDDTRELIDSYRAPLTEELFVRNIKRSLFYAGYRFDRVPEYEIQRCGLEPPILQGDN
ncbi:flagellar motor control protein ZomB [Rhodococcus sp. H29-C3]|uniref:flagellar motor control protein ZomB n=1 Tax=Rhodococcus sp. H29-C3 TaxID=3046307 RepID=UPI0024BACB91|nr:flagellar motor control protein ZomB [Rhodococcus sp. H29-C3]MDJ0359754.1 flagellar motor control protein ZomB [Rhodococcus sp. H29-C3]